MAIWRVGIIKTTKENQLAFLLSRSAKVQCFDSIMFTLDSIQCKISITFHVERIGQPVEGIPPIPKYHLMLS